MKQVLYHSIFASNPYGHGGEKRSCQLQEWHMKSGVEMVSLQLKPNRHLSITALWHTFWLLLRVYGCRGWKSLYGFMRHVKNISLIYDQLIAFFQIKEVETFYWESTRDQWYILPYLANRYNKQVVAFPHNLEALVGGQTSALFTWSAEERFAREMAILRACTHVYAISNEEPVASIVSARINTLSVRSGVLQYSMFILKSSPLWYFLYAATNAF